MARLLPVLWLLATLGCATALAQPAIELSDRMAGVDIAPRVDILEDPTKALSLGDVRRAAAAGRFMPAPARGVNLGYRDSVVWIRVRVDSRNARGPWLLEVGYPLLDRVELHSFWSERPAVSGDQVPMAEKTRLDRHLVFDLPAAGGDDEFYLRVENGGSMNVPLRIWDRESFSGWRRDESFLLGGYFGLLAALVLYNLILYAIVRDRAYAAYCIYVTAMGLVIAVDNGYAQLYLWPDSMTLAHWTQLAVAPFCSAMAAWFTREYLATEQQVPRVDRALVAIFWVGLGMLPFVTMMPRFAIWVAGQGVAVATLAAMTVAGVLAWRRGFRPARHYTIAFAALIGGALLLLARNVSLLPANALTYHGIQVGSALEVLLLSMGLADRINQLRADKQQAQREAYESQAAMIAAWLS